MKRTIMMVMTLMLALASIGTASAFMHSRNYGSYSGMGYGASPRYSDGYGGSSAFSRGTYSRDSMGISLSNYGHYSQGNHQPRVMAYPGNSMYRGNWNSMNSYMNNQMDYHYQPTNHFRSFGGR